MASAVWQPLTEAAEQITAHSQSQNDLAQQTFAELDGIRRDLETRFRELQSWQDRLERREANLERHQLNLDERLSEFTAEVKAMIANKSSKSSKSK